MASNFGIAIDKKGYDFILKLEGDFDVTSAYELIYAIKKLSEEETVTISIYTNGLKSIYPSGLDVFHRHMMPLNSLSTKIVLTGDNASKLSPSNSSMLS